MYLIYSCLWTLLALLGSPYWLFKGLRERKYFGNFVQRLGFGMPPLKFGQRPIWIHAVSVGEVLAAKPLVLALSERLPNIPIVISTITLTGHALARTEIPGRANLIYFPFDWNFCVLRFLRKLQPRSVILLETELWPNFLRACSRFSIPVLVANGRISDRSYPRYRCFKRLMPRILRAVRMIGVQTHEDRKRFLELGATMDQVVVTGNMKFDFPLPVIDEHRSLLERIRAYLALGPEAPLLVVGSSMRGEEPLFIDAFRTVQQTIVNARMILAPRHPERFDEVEQILRASGLSYGRRSQLNRTLQSAPAQILLLDSIGELRAIYSLASVAVIGGSFMPFGGHNLLEPAAFAKAIIFGPHMTNFKELARLFLREQAARTSSPKVLGQALTELLQNSKARHLLGQRALRTFRQNQGATQNTLDFVLPVIS